MLYVHNYCLQKRKMTIRYLLKEFSYIIIILSLNVILFVFMTRQITSNFFHFYCYNTYSYI